MLYCVLHDPVLCYAVGLSEMRGSPVNWLGRDPRSAERVHVCHDVIGREEAIWLGRWFGLDATVNTQR